MSESPLLNNKIESNPDSELTLLKHKHLPVLEKLVDSSRKLKKAANVLIDQLKPNGRSIPVFIAGTGAVGGTLIHQISELSGTYSIKITGVCNTRHYVWDENGINPHNLDSRLDEGDRTQWEEVLKLLKARSSKPLIFVDATGSAEVARLYPAILEAGIHIATPSKRANTFEQAYFERLQELTQSNGLEFHYETTVGAGLPVISTISDLLATGDTITEISGVVSGTMTYLFNALEKGDDFSKAVKKARELGYSEPDPRDDLSGEDVARKFLTLARTIGLKVERSEIDVETLVPEKLISVDRKTFLKEISEVDEYWKSKIDRAREKNETLRYVGKLTNHDISVGIQSIPIDSPIGQLRGTDNLFQIFTRRYSDTPIIIQGPGAGKEVTAAGVLADILKITRKILVSEH